jgi:hypothetical protein
VFGSEKIEMGELCYDEGEEALERSRKRLRHSIRDLAKDEEVMGSLQL